MPTVEFDNLPSLHAAAIDAVSGRTSDVVDPPLTTNHWTSVSGAIAAGVFTLTMNSDAGAFDLECPAPPATMTALRAVIHDPKYRRSMLVSYDTGLPPQFISSKASLARDIKAAIVTNLFADLVSNQMFNFFPQLVMYEFGLDYDDPEGSSVDVNTWIWCFGRGAMTFSAPNIVTSVPDVLWDAANGMWLEHNVTGGTWVCTPENPDAQEPLASVLQFVGSDDSLFAPDTTAIRTLAESINTAGSRPGTVTQQGGRPLLSVGGPPPLELPPWDGTKDTALRSLALACQGFFSQGLVLPLRGGRRAVLGSGALL